MAILKVANIHHDASGFTRTQISTANTVTWYTSNQERMILDSAGTVRVVGTVNASSILLNGVKATDISNSYAFTVGAASNTLANTKLANTTTTLAGTLTITGDAIVGGNVIFDSPASTRIWEPAVNTLAFITNSNESMRITSTGLVGIGTSSPTRQLDVRDPTNPEIVRVQVHNANTTVGSSSDFYASSNNGTEYIQPYSVSGGNAGINAISNLRLILNALRPGGALPAIPIQFATNNTTRMTIDGPLGNVLIGRTDSTVGQAVKLDVVGGINCSSLLINGSAISGGATVTDQTSVTQIQYPTFTTTTSGTASSINVSSTKLTFNVATGTLSATVFNSTSDLNKKENITIITDALEKVSAINGVQFVWKDNKLPSAGVIAQDVEKVMPELVGDDKSVNYNGIIAILIEAIKELRSEIDELKKNR